MRGVWHKMSAINWSTPGFTKDKAYVSAVFSKLAYLEIPEFELKSSSFAKVIPCLTYQQLVSKKIAINLQEFLRELEFGDVFIVPTQYVVAVAIFGQDVIFIALRGTRPLYLSDWMVDFRVSRASVYVKDELAEFHSGFFLHLNECLDALSRRLNEKLGSFSSTVPIYVVGHSLGGAMAAIMHALAGQTFFSKYRLGLDLSVPFDTHSSYTFGMPRYGDRRVMQQLRTPYHVYHVRDLVPGVPPRWLGFESSPKEYRIGHRRVPWLAPQDPQGVRWWLGRLNLGRGVRYHFIERYIHELR
jgi:hypothetical protein